MLFFLWLHLFRGEAGLLVTPMYGYFCDSFPLVFHPYPRIFHIAPRHFHQMHPCISSTLPLRHQLLPKLFTFTFTLCMYSITTPSIHFHHLIVLRPTILFGFVLFMRITNTTSGLCCVVVCSPATALQSLISHSCSLLINTKSSSVLWCPLIYVILWLSRFWKNEPTKAKPFLAISSTRAWPFRFIVAHPYLPTFSSSSGSVSSI